MEASHKIIVSLKDLEISHSPTKGNALQVQIKANEAEFGFSIELKRNANGTIVYLTTFQWDSLSEVSSNVKADTIFPKIAIKVEKSEGILGNNSELEFINDFEVKKHSSIVSGKYFLLIMKRAKDYIEKPIESYSAIADFQTWPQGFEKKFDKQYSKVIIALKTKIGELQAIIGALERKLKVQNVLENESVLLREEVATQNKSISFYQTKLSEAKSNEETMATILKDQFENVTRSKDDELAKLRERSLDSQRIVTGYEKEVEGLRIDKADIENAKINAIRNKLIICYSRQLIAENAELQDRVKALQKLNEDKEIEDKLKEMALKFKDYATEKSTLKRENITLKESIAKLTSELSIIKHESDKKTAEIENGLNRLKFYECRDNALKSSGLTYSKSTVANNNYLQRSATFNQTGNNNRAEYDALTEIADKLEIENDEFREKNAKLNNDNADLRLQRTDLEARLEATKQKCALLTNEVSQLRNSKSAAQKIEKSSKEMFESHKNLLKDYKEQEETIYSTKKENEQLKMENEELKSKNASLIKMIDEIEGFVPMKNQESKLAEYVEQLSKHNLQVLFLKEGSGVYQFGTKKVFVKIEGDKILIRVGGGFISIEKFIDDYLPVEVDRMKRKDPLLVLSKNMEVNKRIAGRCVMEHSPPKKNRMTPGEPFSPPFKKLE